MQREKNGGNSEVYLRMLVEEIHTSIVATIDKDGHPQTRAIDIMLWDEDGVYFLTARGKEFYQQLMDQGYIALSATKGKKAISIRGKIKNIGNRKLDEIFKKNPYMGKIYPKSTRDVLEVFWFYEATGEYFDIEDPSAIVRDSIIIGTPKIRNSGYRILDNCTGCKMCDYVCPQKCIDLTQHPFTIEQNHCLHCGQCYEICPQHAIRKE